MHVDVACEWTEPLGTRTIINGHSAQPPNLIIAAAASCRRRLRWRAASSLLLVVDASEACAHVGNTLSVTFTFTHRGATALISCNTTARHRSITAWVIAVARVLSGAAAGALPVGAPGGELVHFKLALCLCTLSAKDPL